MRAIKGIVTALVTPFTKSDEIDTNGVRWLSKNSVESGVHSVICVGSLGESPLLTDEERLTVIKTVVDEVNGKIPVIAGVGDPSTSKAIANAKKASDLGVDAVTVLPPFYFNIGDEAVFLHYEKIASSISVPVMIYNFPGTTKVNMSPTLVSRLTEIDNIVGIKNSVDSLTHLRQIIRAVKKKREDFIVTAGMEEYLIAGLLLGADGAVSGISNFVPGTMVDIYNSVIKGRIQEASEKFNNIIIPLKELAPPPEPIAALKVGVSLFAPIQTSVRLPLIEISNETKQKMKKVLDDHGLLQKV